MQAMKAEVQSLQTDTDKLQRAVLDISVHLESITDRGIRIVAEGHTDLSRKLDASLKVENERELFLVRLNYLESEVNQIKKKLNIA